MRTQKWLGSIIVAVVAILLLVPAAFAQGPAGNPGRGAVGPGSGTGVRLGGPQNSLVAVVAEQLGLTRADIIAELQAGQTLAEVIAAHGANPEEVVAAFLAARAEQLAELVTDGRISQEQADAWLATMKENTLNRLDQAWVGRGSGAGFVDEDGDGVCDNYGGPGLGQRQGGRMGQRGQ